MATTTVRLDPDEERTLDQLAAIHGGRSNTLRLGLQLLSQATKRQLALGEFLHDWDAETSPVDEESIERMTSRFDL
jgi:predicted transcriptional regulator